MLEQILAYLRCPQCAGTRLQSALDGVQCHDCGVAYAQRGGIVDFLGHDAAEVITPFQRIMQSPLVVSIYESLWRRLGYFVASSRPFHREVQTVLRLQQFTSAQRTLDLACGTGVFTRPLASRARGIVVGLDLSRPMLRQAQRLARRDRLDNIILMRGTAFRLPFISGTFQHVNCCGALHLFDLPEQALNEMGRVLHPEGWLSIQTTIRPEHSAGMAYFLERFIRFGFFKETDLRERIRLHGFKILESERHRISYTFLAQHIL